MGGKAQTKRLQAKCIKAVPIITLLTLTGNKYIYQMTSEPASNGDMPYPINLVSSIEDKSHMHITIVIGRLILLTSSSQH